MDQKLVLTDSSRMTTGHGRVGQNRLLNGVEPHTTGCVRFDLVFSFLRISMNRLRFRFEPKREKNRTEPDFQTLIKLNPLMQKLKNSNSCIYYTVLLNHSRIRLYRTPYRIVEGQNKTIQLQLWEYP